MRAWLMILAVVALAAVTTAAEQKSPSAPAKSAAGSTAAPINLNTATQAQLETLPGVGAAMAQRILEYRQKNGSFKKIEDLMNVKGIGEKAFLKLKPLLTVTQKAEATGGSAR
jgi:competence protein ComEA